MTDKFNLRGKTALVTGASGGLGRHFAHVLGHAGAKVIVAGRRQAPLRDLADDLSARGIGAAAISLDVTDPAGVKAGFDQARALAGVPDIVVNTAGMAASKPSLALSPGEWDDVLDVNLKGCWLVANEAAHRLVEASRPGSIINVSSILGARVAGNVLPYTVSKAGLEQMTKALALEWARHAIRVNALAPGYVETDMNRDFFASDAGRAMIRRIPQRRLGRVEDLDGALLLLASDASAYMTGSSIVVDGGHLQSTL